MTDAESSRPAPIASPKWLRSPGLDGFDAILNVQGDEPFVSADAVRGALRQVHDGAFRSAPPPSRARDDDARATPTS